MKILLMLISGLLLFLGGMRCMSCGLEALWGSSFASAIEKCTKSRLSAFLCGLIFTAFTQSSSLATVLVVGVVDAGLLRLAPAIAVIIGANVGTTITGQLLSFQLYDYALPITVAGILWFLSTKGSRKNAGKAIAGLGVLLFGLQTMGGALGPLGRAHWFGEMMKIAAFHPFLGIAAGALTTAIVQSSSAVVGITLALAKEGFLNLAAGAALIVGADVGTCITSLLAGISTNTAARQAAAAHLLFNIFSVFIILPLFPFFIYAAASSSNLLPRQLANAHTLYNLGGAIVLLLLLTPFQRLVENLVREDIAEKKRISTVFSEVLRKWF